MNEARYAVVEDGTRVVLKDLGPWDEHPTITNDAEGVVKREFIRLKGRRLFYIDSEGNMDELQYDVDFGTFIGFKPGPSR